MNKINLISCIFQLISGLILVGLAIFYFVVRNWLNGIIFLVVGIIFVAMPIRSFFMARKAKRDEEEQKNSGEKHGFL